MALAVRCENCSVAWSSEDLSSRSRSPSEDEEGGEGVFDSSSFVLGLAGQEGEENCEVLGCGGEDDAGDDEVEGGGDEEEEEEEEEEEAIGEPAFTSPTSNANT